ncbi:hypothetical protein N7510_005068 [Penicillium lagena]|uniref:uncharacterized protein n=1 Tax=Penicillium lagena TaxID=94218 RepID=UPI0025423F5E|nr:uncharacterized protein N7510_005068 [Penicillium lagena]KAJ5621084.1 hypothetical protein N7510_005068 [Penicillium lagena]
MCSNEEEEWTAQRDGPLSVPLARNWKLSSWVCLHDPRFLGPRIAGSTSRPGRQRAERTHHGGPRSQFGGHLDGSPETAPDGLQAITVSDDVGGDLAQPLARVSQVNLRQTICRMYSPGVKLRTLSMRRSLFGGASRSQPGGDDASLQIQS